MGREIMSACLNEWMRRYTEDPAAFEAEFQTVGDFLKEQADGVEPTYGQTSALYMERLAAELKA